MANIDVHPGENVQNAAARLKSGDSLTLKPGLHYGYVYLEASNDITIIGEEGAVLENTAPLDEGWMLAEDSDNFCSLAGHGVYKIHCPLNAWEVLDAQGVNHHRLDWHYCHQKEPHAYYITAWQAMLYENGARPPNPDGGADWWNGIEALFVWDQSNQHLYLKYRDGRKPASNLRYSTGPESHQSYPEINNSCIYLWNARGINVIGLEIRGTFNTVSICRSSDVNIEGCKFGAFDLATRVQDNCQNVRVHDSYFNKNTLGMNALKPVSKMSSEDPYPDKRLSVSHMYMMHKFWMTRSDSGQGCALSVRNGWNESTNQVLWPRNIRFDNNETECCAYAVDLMGGDGIEIDRNFCHNHVDIGFQRSDAARNISIHDNELHEAGYLLFRWHRQDQEAGDNFIYNNRLSDIDDVSEFMFFSGYVQPPPDSPLRIAIYNNSYAGARGLFQTGGQKSMRGLCFVNNLINNGPNFWMEGGEQNGHWGPNGAGAWDYNAHCGNQQVYGSYVGSHNVYNMPRVWAGNQIEKGFVVPEGHVTKGRGVDVSQPFEIAGRTWGPLPGFAEGESTNIGYIARENGGGIPVAPEITPDVTLATPGETVTVSWSGASTPTDWIAGFPKDAPASDDQYWDWFYVSGTKESTGIVPEGSVDFVMPQDAGEYEFRLYSANSFNLLAESEVVTVSLEPPDPEPEPEPEPKTINVVLSGELTIHIVDDTAAKKKKSKK